MKKTHCVVCTTYWIVCALIVAAVLLATGCNTAHKEATVAQSPDLATTAWGLANGYTEANPFALPANITAHVLLAREDTSCETKQKIVSALAMSGGLGGAANLALFAFPTLGIPTRLLVGSIAGGWNKHRVEKGRTMCPYEDFRMVADGEYEAWLDEYVYEDIKAYIALREARSQYVEVYE
jgi:hypothetical protein